MANGIAYSILGSGPLATEAIAQYRAEDAAVDIRCYGPNVPELLATTDWTRIVHEDRDLRDDPRARRVVELLPLRQSVLLRGCTRASFVISEDVVKRLTHCPRDYDIVREQLHHLHLLASHSSNISLRIYGFGARRPPPSAPFTITTNAQGRQMAFDGDFLSFGLRISRDAVALATYDRIFDDLTEHSLTEYDSRALLARALRHYPGA
ncbi:Scr1 family TA system antitoxin-like transcriptional regulator [Amycolatopsis sp. CA-230715]|uniref:Scr1 family TA system antitoxin-like transcriptional regulator n=1 Tax=Amycolatopsis sp. CA-230715 TaxID=2745196 RepID=UPI001C02D89C|nr:Scr1 family TA system antitoxin-like transcriptional regulator [Amycolatopsis sp. CA-230715]